VNHKIVKAESLNPKEISLLSFEGIAGLNITLDEKAKFSEACANYGLAIIPKISEEILNFESQAFSTETIKLLVRRALYPITFFFWNQVYRMQRMFNADNQYAVYSFEDRYHEIQIIEEFEDKVCSPEFNEFMPTYLSEIWNIRKVGAGEIFNFNIGIKKQGKNHLFSLGKYNENKKRLYALVEKHLNFLLSKRRFPVLTFANAETALRLNGFYLKHFRQLTPRWTFEKKERNLALREKVFQADHLFDNNFLTFLKIIGFNDNQFLKAVTLFKFFLTMFYPIQFLEGIVSNLVSSKEMFTPNDYKAILSSGDGDTYSSFILAYAKEIGFKVIKAQHGGHYGYLRDNRPALDIELPSADIFFTWGWSRMHPGKQVENIKCLPMPSPWLSERKKYWKGVNFKKKKEFDIIWMPQMMKRFVGTPTGASSVSRDVLDRFSFDMLSIAKALEELKVRVYCKPYNLITVSLLKNTFQKIHFILGNKYVLDREFDKGLHKQLLQKGKLILWDQPGTGFLECLACGIPTMIIWTRLFCEEEAWCQDDFKALEKVGIVHRSPESFQREYLVFQEAMIVWMYEPKRLDVIHAFCKKYALTDPAWDKVWSEYLSKNF